MRATKGFIFTADAIIAFYLITILLSILLLISYTPKVYVQQYQSIAKDTLVFLESMKLKDAYNNSFYPYSNQLLLIKNNSETSWPMFRRTLQHNASIASVYPNATNSTDRLWWSAKIGPVGIDTPVYSSPTLYKGKIVIASRNGTYSFDENTGVKLWYYPLSADSSPAVHDGKIFLGSVGNEFYALDELGNVAWNFSAGNRFVSSPIVSNGKVIIGSMDATLYARDESSGASLWNFTTVGNISSSPVLYNGRIYIFSVSPPSGGPSRGVLYSLDEQSGSQLWSYDVKDPVSSTPMDPSPVISGGVVYIGNGNYFYAINATNGTQIWNVSIGSLNFTSTPVFDANFAYAGYTNGIMTINLTGHTAQPNSLSSTVYSSPIISNDTIVVGTYGGDVYIFKKDTININSLLWHYKIGKPIYSSPAVVNGRVYVGANDGMLYAFGNCSIWDENLSVLDTIAAFWIIDKRGCAQALAKEYLQSAIPRKYGYELVVKRQNTTGFDCNGNAGAPADSLYTNDCNQTKYQRLLIQDSRYISGVVRSGTMTYYDQPIQIELRVWG
ncbi:MAG: Outer membrane protein assembly factor BamB, contains PQQ-like beta-propeller repeat [Candidatus Fermentimicrarchaeum limneticum]|uniref:Outer membrane protein assembly factor BamB, contains PQQ-like beta-propeller repeat n=1 Tax=Fermentimicrarchaeum limneticum TaxID=2795018 RepID=A0A7D5XC87_FERL1|nr:MAG: Outer membrane protein assembly factor BamB, contains PQQ-like beta-propeller repeat [Candidatus Fermentimicrarchaeum limneticum]